MSTFKSFGPILALCFAPLASLAAFLPADGPSPGTVNSGNGPLRLQVRTFPDPCADEFTLVIPDGMSGHTRAMLLDGSYRTVLDWPLGFSETAGNRVDVPMSGLDAGTYTLRIWDEYGDAGATIIEHQ